MKKIFLTLALMALIVASCNKVQEPARLTEVDSTAIQVDSAITDSASIDTTAVK